MAEWLTYLLFALSCAPLAFWWCCCGSGSGSEGSGSGPLITCCREIWWPTEPSGAASWPPMLQYTISGSCCTGTAFTMNGTRSATLQVVSGNPRWNTTWTLNNALAQNTPCLPKGTVYNTSGRIFCENGIWKLETNSPIRTVDLTLLSCDPFHATAEVPDTFWVGSAGPPLCNNTSHLEVTE